MYPRPEQVDDELYSKMHYEAECYDHKTHTFARRQDVKAFQYIEPVCPRCCVCACACACVCACVCVCVCVSCGGDGACVDGLYMLRLPIEYAVGGNIT
jgi:hypothetical protein